MEFAYNFARNHPPCFDIFFGRGGGCSGSKPEDEPQLHQTQKFDLASSSFLLACLALCVNGYSAGASQCQIVCEMHVAQLLLSLSSPNAEQFNPLLRSCYFQNQWDLVTSSGSVHNNHDVGHSEQHSLRYSLYQYQQMHYIMHFIINFSYIFWRNLQIQ